MRPLLKTGLVRTWRDATTLQLGLAPGRCAILSDASSAVAAALDQFDGTSTVQALIDSGPLTGDVLIPLLQSLADGGLLEDADADTCALHSLPARERERLRPDLAAWSLATRATDGGLGVLARRRAAWIEIRSTGRLGIACAHLLAAAGIGRLTFADASTITPDTLAPLGLRPEHLGRRASHSVNDHLLELFPATRRTPAMNRPPDVTVLAPADAVVDDDTINDLMRRDATHLPVVQRGGGFVLGPFVVPGSAACVRCVDHAAAERDPSWPWMLTQLHTPAPFRRPAVIAHDTVLGTAAAALVSLQVLAFIDGQRPLLMDAVGHLAPPNGVLEVHAAALHPACGCGWVGSVTRPGEQRVRSPRTMAR